MSRFLRIFAPAVWHGSGLGEAGGGYGGLGMTGL